MVWILRQVASAPNPLTLVEEKWYLEPSLELSLTTSKHLHCGILSVVADSHPSQITFLLAQVQINRPETRNIYTHAHMCMYVRGEKAWGSSLRGGFQCTCFSLQSSTPSSISCCLSCKPSSKVLIWPSTYARSRCPRFLEESERRTASSLQRKHPPPLLWSLRWRDPIFKGPQCNGDPNGKNRRVN